MDSRPTCRSESGQAIVEAAFMLPAMIFLILCILQLTLIQQARIMVEYAAFNAARAGVVHNMNNGVDGSDPTSVMRNAAVYSILPAYGRTDTYPNIGITQAAYEAADAGMRAAGVGMVKVGVLNPHVADFATFGAQLNEQEIDFDDMRPAAAPATLLSIQVRYLFELRVPFANKMIQAIWFASQSTLATWTGPILTNPTLGTPTGPSALGPATASGTLADGMPGGLNLGALSTLANSGHFYLPVDAWYSMRMQSNPYKTWAAP